MKTNRQKMTAANRMLIDKTLRLHLQLQQFLLNWFQENGRDLPWRLTYQPYHIWISEIMLQQTQMERVVAYFERWMKHFPDIVSLAAADEEKVLRLWEGLGYYSRARNIHRTAGILAKQYNGQLPTDHQQLLKLPGIGEYTAGAIMSLAFNEKHPVVDANVERLFARLFNIDGPVKERANHKLIWQLARELVPEQSPRIFNQALMELGALVCRPKNPDCSQCPLNKLCESFKLGIVAERPAIPPGKKIIRIEMATGVLQHQGKFFIQKRPVNGVWANLWEFPGGRIEPREFYEETELSINLLHKIGIIKHSYTRYRVRLHCYMCRLHNSQSDPCLHAAQEYRWATGAALDDFAFPAPHRILIDMLRSTGSL
jgi:A/G-specific adenine glycosylase